MPDTSAMGSARPRRRLRCGLAASLLTAAALAAPAHADTTIGTASVWDGVQSLMPFGSIYGGNTPTYGQTITVPDGDTHLARFAFELDMPADVPFRASVYPWDATAGRIAGDALWTGSAVTTTAYDRSGASYQLVSFETGGLALAPGAQVLLVLTTLQDGGTDGAPGYVGAVLGDTDAYAGGQFVSSSALTFGALLAGSFDSLDGTFVPYADTAFSATFSSPTAYDLSDLSVSSAAPRAGRSVPVSWTLADGEAPVTSSGAMSLSSSPCGGGAVTAAVAAGGSGLQSDGAGGWQFNWKTDRAWAGTCRTLTLTLADGTAKSVRLTFR